MKILIPIIVGAIIGYCTNWLAIKMLFRPYYEKRIMGMKVPFTPGLIPKERERIGKNIGETVGVYLLSPETIIESLSNKKTDDQVKFWIEDKINKLKESEQSIKDLLDSLPDESSEGLIKGIEENIINIVVSQIKGEKFKSLIFSSIQNKINNINPNNIYEMIDEKLGAFLGDLSSSPELKDGLINLMESKFNELLSADKTISELLPEEIIIYINKYIDENGFEIADTIRQSFKDPSIQNKLKTSISELVLQNMSKLITAFISPDLISEKIFHMIEKYIDSEDTNKDIIILIKSLLDKLLKSKVSTMVPGIVASVGDDGFSKFTDILIDYISDKDNHNSLLELIKDKLKNSELENKDKIMNYLTVNIDKILDSMEINEAISKFIQDMVKQFMNKPISSMVSNVDEDIVLKFYDFFKILFDRFARNELPHIIEMFDISKIVEDKVNSFDVDFTERLILEIANKELKAITWLGALLGGLLGILTPLIQMLY